jgi:hypothetical protein
LTLCASGRTLGVTGSSRLEHSMRIEVNSVRLFFDVEGAKLVPDGPVMREKPTRTTSLETNDD